MNSRERIRAAINHQATDVLPIDFGGMRSSGINAMAYNKLLTHLGISDKCAKVYDVFQQLAQPDLEVLDIMNADVVQAHRMYPAFGISIADWKPGKLQDGSDCFFPKDHNPVVNANGDFDILAEDGKTVISRMPKGGFYFDLINRKFEKMETVEDAKAAQFEPMSDQEIDFIADECKRLYETTDRAILLEFGGNVFEQGQSDLGYEKFYCDLAVNPEMMHVWFDRLTDSYLDSLQRLMPRVAPYVDIIQMGDDLGTQNAPQVSPEMYREMIKPYHKKVYSYINKNYPDIKVFLHCCGAIYKLIPDLIDAGVQILNPVQISANGMDPKKLKEEFGGDIVFWGGGADTQTFIPTASISEIRDHVAELIEIFSPGSGFVFNQIHNIQYNVEPEKIMAIYDVAKGYRQILPPDSRRLIM